MGTFEDHAVHLTIPWVDPSLLPKTQTTHDDITKRLTIEDSSPNIGDRRVCSMDELSYPTARGGIEVEE